ncbi:hypothetical protein CFK39_06335 [Brachybacterium avium]|uniref:Uncharacterized protein n=1 Tax=Brachybacterium avium TaxID=2017485 RepID=A0A220UC71_9MICO|nr:hypothetical protein [Brachybacterium avium]ASK65512.1 hypothetical protein CFK39_06335 [Brachybacterium avium]
MRSAETPHRVLTALRGRARRVAVLVGALLLLGTATAAAYWVASAQVQGTVEASTVGLVQELGPVGDAPSLSGTYTARAPALAGVVSLSNTGSRAATATLTVAARGGAVMDPTLSEAVQVAVAPVGNATECTPQRAMSTSVRGTPASGVTLDKVQVDPGQTVVVCVQTSLAAGDLAVHAGKQFEFTISSSLRYADGEQWTVQAEPLTVSQSIEKDRFEDLPRIEFGNSGNDPTVKWKAVDKGDLYRLSMAHESTPRDRVPFPSEADSQISVAQIVVHGETHKDLLQEFVDSDEDGDGLVRLYIETSKDGGQTWSLTAYAQLHISSKGNGGIKVKGS